MGKRHGGAYRELHPQHAFIQPVQDWRGLRDMAEAVAGDGDDEMGHGTGFVYGEESSRPPRKVMCGNPG